jgi:hypothetical protein
VLASGLGHGLAPPWLQLHHTPKVAKQPDNSVVTVVPSGGSTLCGGRRTIISGNRLTAVGMAAFKATNYTEDGKAFDRLGRATVALGRRSVGEEWVAQHTHVLMFPGTPARSFGTKREYLSGL